VFTATDCFYVRIEKNEVANHLIASWHYSTSQKDTGSIPDEALHFSIDLILIAARGPVVDSGSDRNEYQESSWG
jgi:hypothetical protein